MRTLVAALGFAAFGALAAGPASAAPAALDLGIETGLTQAWHSGAPHRRYRSQGGPRCVYRYRHNRHQRGYYRFCS